MVQFSGMQYIDLIRSLSFCCWAGLSSGYAAESGRRGVHVRGPLPGEVDAGLDGEA